MSLVENFVKAVKSQCNQMRLTGLAGGDERLKYNLDHMLIFLILCKVHDAVTGGVEFGESAQYVLLQLRVVLLIADLVERVDNRLWQVILRHAAYNTLCRLVRLREE